MSPRGWAARTSPSFPRTRRAIELCLYDASGQHEIERVALPERTGDVFHGFVSGVGAGDRYGLRAHGRYDPRAGHRFNAAKLLVDPYARALDRAFAYDAALTGGGDDLGTRDDTDSAAVRAQGGRDAVSAPRDGRSTAGAVARDDPVRAALARLHAGAPGRAGSPPRHLRGPRPPCGACAPDTARRHHRRADADRGGDRRASSRAPGPHQLLGLQPGSAVRPRPAARAGRHRRSARLRGGAARGRHRSDRGRRPQPHRRRRCARADVVAARSRQRDLLPDSRPGSRAVHRRHGLRQHARAGPAAGAPPRAGRASLLRGSGGRGRFPLRPRHDPRSPRRRLRSRGTAPAGRSRRILCCANSS